MSVWCRQTLHLLKYVSIHTAATLLAKPTSHIFHNSLLAYAIIYNKFPIHCRVRELNC